jgi:ketosteroid isomerase-like protein
MRRYLLVMALGAIVLSGCSGSNEAAFGRADSTKIKEMNEELMASFNSRDMPKLLDLYSGSAVIMPPNSAALRGRELIESFYNDLFEDGASDLRLEARDVSGSGTLAFQTGTYAMKRKANEDGSFVNDRGKFLFILRGHGGYWRIEHAVWNSDLPVDNHVH